MNGRAAPSGRERVEFWKVASLPGVRALSVRNSWHRWTLFHETYAITAASRGQGSWRYRQKDREITPGTIMLIEPGNVHVTTAVKAAAGFDTLFVDPQLVASVAGRMGMPGSFPHFSRADSRDSRLVTAFVRLHQTLREVHSETLERAEAFEEAIFCLFRTSCETSPEQPDTDWAKLRRVRDRLHGRAIEEEPAGALTLRELADDVGLTPINLIRGFKSRFGLPPYQYLVRLRLARALKLIEAGPSEALSSLADVAQRVGFFDLAHMDKHFRRMLRLSPSEYAVALGSKQAWTRARRGR